MKKIHLPIVGRIIDILILYHVGLECQKLYVKI